MAEAARLDLPYPEAVVVDEESLGEQSLALASQLPERPIVLGGCCCSHVGAFQGLASRYDRLALVWVDAHGDLNTPESSPSGNQWGMPLRMILQAGVAREEDVALVGARNLDPPEEEFLAASALHTGEWAVDRAVSGGDAVYVALDGDAIDAGDVTSFMPEPGGLTLPEAVQLLWKVRQLCDVAGAGFTGFLDEERNVGPLTQLAAALGL
jgi:arginase